MENLKPFDPADIDETLTRVVTYGRDTYLMFPYISAVGVVPKFNSISCTIRGSTATLSDFASLTALIRQSRDQAEWFICFNTPWLLGHDEAEDIKQRASIPKPKRA